MIEALVQARADVDAQDEQGRTPLDSALVNNREQAAALLRKLRTHATRRGSELSMGEEKEQEKIIYINIYI